MKLLVLAGCLTALSACSTIPSTPPTVPRPKPAASMVLPPPFPKPAGPTAANLAQALKDGSDSYSVCRERMSALIEWVNRGE